MSSPEDIKSEASLLAEIEFSNRDKLKPKEIEELLKTGVIKNKEEILEIIPLIEKDGFKATVKYLSENRDKEFIEILKDSSIFNLARRNYFLDLTEPLRAFANMIDGIYKCPKCGSNKVRTIQKQTRGADEPTTEFNTCICGHSWVTS